MNRVLVLGILGVLLIGVVVFQDELTGFGTTVQLAITVDQFELGKIVGLEHQLILTEYDPLNITVVFKNVGSVAIDEKINLTIEDLNMTKVLKNWNDGTFSLEVGEERTFTVVYYPNLTGFYWVHANVSYGTENKNANRFSLFFVRELYPDADDDDDGDAGGAGDTTTPTTETGTAKLNITYTRELTMSPGQIGSFFVIIDNIGDRTINDIKFLGSAPFPFVTEPVFIDRLSPGFRGVFLVTVNIPVTLTEGTYALDFSINADEIIENRQLLVHIDEISLREQIWQTILNYRYMIQQLEGEIDKAEELGSDVSDVRKSLDDARNLLQDAEDAFYEEDYLTAQERLVRVRIKLIEVVRLLALLLAPVPFILPGFLPLFLLALIVVFIIIFIVGKRRRSRKRPE